MTSPSARATPVPRPLVATIRLSRSRVTTPERRSDAGLTSADECRDA